MSDPLKDMLRPAELIARWRSRFSVRTLENWRRAGKGPVFTKFGGRVFYQLAHVEAYEREHMSQGK